MAKRTGTVPRKQGGSRQPGVPNVKKGPMSGPPKGAKSGN